MFNPGIQALGVLAKDDQVDVRVLRFQSRKALNWAEIGIQLKLLAQLNIHAAEAVADRGSHWPFQGEPGALDGLDEFLGNVGAGFLERIRADRETLPFKLQARGLENTNGGTHDFGANAITGNQGAFVSHKLFSPARGRAPCGAPLRASPRSRTGPIIIWLV